MPLLLLELLELLLLAADLLMPALLLHAVLPLAAPLLIALREGTLLGGRCLSAL